MKNPFYAAFRYAASTAEAWELSSLAHKVSNIHEHLKKQLTLCHQQIGGPLTFEFSKSYDIDKLISSNF